MHLWRPCLVLGLLAAFAADAAVVYKWTDADGVVHFSDQPVPGAEKITTSSSSSNGIGGAVRNSATTQVQTPPPAAATQFSIDSPAKEQMFYGDEIVPVRLTVTPPLKADQTIAWYLNGQQLTDQSPRATSFTLQTLPRGTYVISATITDATAGTSQSADGVTFYVRQPSELDLQHRTH